VKILIIRLMGLGDVAAILIPAVKLLRNDYPQAQIDVLTHGPGGELMRLVCDVTQVHTISPEQWPDDIHPAVQSFLGVAEKIAADGYDQVINLDTWFMPCFLARVFQELGLDVRGNFMNMSTRDFFAHWKARDLPMEYFHEPARFLASTFPNMGDWTTDWWNRHPDAGSYPHFYLRHCCGFAGNIDISLATEPDLQFRDLALGRKIIALSLSGSKPSKQYRQQHLLRNRLEELGYFVWGQFDGTQSMQATLARLAVTDLLVTVATSTQWLARLVACPSLMLPGVFPPSILGAEYVVERQTKCQYCVQKDCPEKINFACMDVPPEQILQKVRERFQQN